MNQTITPVNENWLRTDAGSADSFAREFSNRVRFNQTTGKWMEYDGMRWNHHSGNGAAERLFSDSTKAIWREYSACSGHLKRMTLFQWANYVSSARGMRNTLSLAKAHSEIEVFATDFDQDPYMFNCEDGTIDLRSGKLQPHRASDNLSQLAPVRSKENTGAKLWFSCLDRWHSGDKKTISYLQKLAGMCLTGDTSSRVFPIFYGHGKNGKSIFLDTLMGLMGDYASVAPRTLLKETRNEGHATEIASLFGKRFIIASETGKYMQLKTSLVKAMTGDAKMTGRFMRQDFFDFKLTNKTILVTQNLPIIDESSNAIWDRVHKLEWGVRIPDAEQDTHLLEKLKKEWPGILKWAVRGCLKWQQDGILNPTESIREQTETYRKEQLPLNDFIEDMCVIGSNCHVSLSELYSVYSNWGGKAGTFRNFNTLIRELGYRSKEMKINVKTVKCWIGLGLCSK